MNLGYDYIVIETNDIVSFLKETKKHQLTLFHLHQLDALHYSFYFSNLNSTHLREYRYFGQNAFAKNQANRQITEPNRTHNYQRISYFQDRT